MYDTILVPTDGSDVAQAAVGRAINLAEMYGAEIHALYVADADTVIDHGFDARQVDRIRQGNFEGMPELRKNAESATGYVREQAEAHGLEVVEHHAGGKPHWIIVEYARDNDIDLIVMGSHGREGVRRVLLGSVTERVLRSTHVPVLVIDSQDGGE